MEIPSTQNPVAASGCFLAGKETARVQGSRSVGLVVAPNLNPLIYDITGLLQVEVNEAKTYRKIYVLHVAELCSLLTTHC